MREEIFIQNKIGDSLQTNNMLCHVVAPHYLEKF